MTDEDQLSEDEVGRRIVAGMSLVHDLFNELDTLFNFIRNGLISEGVQIISGKGFLLPKTKKSPVAADRFLKSDMGIIAGIEVASSDESDDDVDDDEDFDDGGSEKNKVQQITPDSQYLVVRAIVLDRNADAAEQDDFTPSVVAAVLSNLSSTSTKKSAKQQGEQKTHFGLKREDLRQLAKKCRPCLSANSQISYRVSGVQLEATITSATTKPLASFNSEDAVNNFVSELVDMI